MCDKNKYDEVDCALRNLFEGMDIGPSESLQYTISFLMNVCRYVGATESQFKELCDYMSEYYSNINNKEGNHE